MNLPQELLKDLKKYKLDIEDILNNPKLYKFFQEVITHQYKEKDLINKIFNAAPITISCVNKNLEYVKVNEKMAAVVKETPQHFVGKKVGNTTKDPAFSQFTNDLFDTSDNSLSRELKVIKNNKEINYVVNGSKYNNGEYAVIIGMDISLLKEYEKNAAFSEKMKDLGTLCSGVAHEINNPLQAINTIVDLIDIELEDAESMEDVRKEIPENLKEIRTIVKQASAITGSLRSFSRNTQEEKETTVELNRIVQDALILIKNKVNKVNFSHEFQCQKDINFLAREVQLIQVLVNFISNGVDAVLNLPKEQQWMKIIIKSTKNKIQFHFIDGGNGIPKDIETKIFDAFFTTKGTRKGTGLGLSICKDIIKKHNGDIILDRTDKNTHFIIEVPCKQD